MTLYNATPYNASFMDTSNTVVDVFKGINDLSKGLLGTGILIATFAIMAMVFKNYPTRVTLLAASFITTIEASLFFYLGWVSQTVWIIVAIFLFVSLIMNIIAE